VSDFHEKVLVKMFKGNSSVRVTGSLSYINWINIRFKWLNP